MLKIFVLFESRKPLSLDFTCDGSISTMTYASAVSLPWLVNPFVFGWNKTFSQPCRTICPCVCRYACACIASENQALKESVGASEVQSS